MKPSVSILKGVTMDNPNLLEKNKLKDFETFLSFEFFNSDDPNGDDSDAFDNFINNMTPHQWIHYADRYAIALSSKRAQEVIEDMMNDYMGVDDG